MVEDYVKVTGASIEDNAIISGISQPTGGSFKGTSIAGYDYMAPWTITDGVQDCHIPWGGWYEDFWADTCIKPRGLVASYRTEAWSGQICWDEFGAQHALMRGDITRTFDSGMNSDVMDLDGTGDYLVLDRSLCDFIEGSFSITVKPDDNTDRTILFMGSSASVYLELELNSSGKAVFTIDDGSTTETVTSTSTIPTGSWTNIAVTLDGTNIKLYVDGGAPEDTEPATLVPDDVLGPNDYSAAEGLYVGRDWSGNVYDGKIEDARFYNVAMTQAEVSNELRRGGDTIGVLYAGENQNFTNNLKLQTGVRNGRERTLDCWIFPRTSDDVSYYEGLFDSTDEITSGNEGSGIGLDNGQIVVRLDNVGMWNTGVSISTYEWQRVTLRFDGSNAYLYMNGNTTPAASKSYSASEDDVKGKNYRIGWAMDINDLEYYFDGRIADAYIYDNSKVPAGGGATPTEFPVTETPTPANTLRPTGTPWGGPQPLIDLQASGLSLGTLTNWYAGGSIQGTFDNDGSDPTVQDVAGKRCVTFDGNDRMKYYTTAPTEG